MHANFPMPSLTVSDIKKFEGDQMVFFPFMSFEAASIISALVGGADVYSQQELCDIVYEAVRARYKLPKNSGFDFNAKDVLTACEVLIEAGILRIVHTSLTIADVPQYALAEGFKVWMTEFSGDIAVSTRPAIKRFSMNRDERDAQPHAAFGELADTALLDPRIRDILDDMRHLGLKAGRVLSGS